MQLRLQQGPQGCCGKEALYEDPGIREIPGEITETSFGCGDPVTLASLVEGQTVVDLGSGGGLDVSWQAEGWARAGM